MIYQACIFIYICGVYCGKTDCFPSTIGATLKGTHGSLRIEDSNESTQVPGPTDDGHENNVHPHYITAGPLSGAVGTKNNSLGLCHGFSHALAEFENEACHEHRSRPSSRKEDIKKITGNANKKCQSEFHLHCKRAWFMTSKCVM